MQAVRTLTFTCAGSLTPRAPAGESAQAGEARARAGRSLGRRSRFLHRPRSRERLPRDDGMGRPHGVLAGHGSQIRDEPDFGPCTISPHVGTFSIPTNATAWIHTHPFTEGEVQTSCEPIGYDANGHRFTEHTTSSRIRKTLSLLG
jgi:hypothetical protein